MESNPASPSSAVPPPRPDAPPPTPSFDFTIAEYVPGGRNVVVRITGDDTTPKTTFCSADFLGNGADEGVRGAAISTISEYTVGSCGPRGFYGTTPKHLELEDALATFLGAPESITYSDATATVASVIPAFAKRGDVLLVDAGAGYGIMTGARLSRSKVVPFRHNDMEDLEDKLRAAREADETRGDESARQRRFIVVEGLYTTTWGDLCPLPDILRLAREYRWRVIVDDSGGFGVLGATGRGTTEHYGLAPLDVDVLIGSLSTSLSSVGGFCIGSREVVDHQRLSGAGYCYSASAPPYLCAAATAALRRMESQPRLLSALRIRAEALHAALVDTLPGFTIVSEPASPVKHLLLTVGPGAGFPRVIGDADVGGSSGGPHASAATSSPTRGGAGGGSVAVLVATAAAAAAAAAAAVGGVASDLAPRLHRLEDGLLRAVALRAAELGVLVSRSHSMPGDASATRPVLKVSVTLAHTEAEIDALVRVLAAAAQDVLFAGSVAAASAIKGVAFKGPVASSGDRRRAVAAASSAQSPDARRKR